MAYYKVIIKEEFVYEVLVSAKDEEEAKALTTEHEWGEPIHVGTHAYDVIELQEKKHE